MAVMAERGSLRPTLITSGIAVVLLVWSTYAASAAGLVVTLPLLKPALVGIITVYLVRGVVGFFLVASPIMGNSSSFWFWSSLICSGFGMVHLAGLFQVWSSI